MFKNKCIQIFLGTVADRFFQKFNNITNCKGKLCIHRGGSDPPNVSVVTALRISDDPCHPSRIVHKRTYSEHTCTLYSWSFVSVVQRNPTIFILTSFTSCLLAGPECKTQMWPAVGLYNLGENSLDLC